MDQQFYASGKILLTSEFLILNGAKALAVPLKLGQSLELHRKKELGVLNWIAEYDSKTWFKTEIVLDEFKIRNTNSIEKSENLIYMLRKLREIQPGFLDKLHSADVITKLEFDPKFGFGSSSTLTSLLAQWAGVDAMQFHFRISRGSGYDVACAHAKSAILYEIIDEMPVVQSVDFQPEFIDNLWLVYLGKKQQTSKSVAAFLSNYEANQEDLDFYSGLTCDFLKAKTLKEFGGLIIDHEKRLSELLDLPVLKQERFSKLNGYVKSLGAWGGDFALLATSWQKEKLDSYLQQIGIDQWFAFKDLVL
jgi:mevalonate kinase